MDPAKLKLGKRPPLSDPRTLKLARYFTPELPPPPSSVRWDRGVEFWPMFRNDELGDCTCATVGHMVQCWTGAVTGNDVVLSDQQIVDAYATISGYRPGHPETDNGAYVLDVLKFWRSTGIGGHKIGVFAEVDHHNREHVQQALHLFGGLYLGCALPLSAQTQAVWDVPPEGLTGKGRPGSWGGHAINAYAYSAEPGSDDLGVTVCTWGAPKRMTWEWFEAYCDEAYAIISPDWFADDAKAPVGFDAAQLREDLGHLGNLPPQTPTFWEQVRQELDQLWRSILAFLFDLFRHENGRAPTTYEQQQILVGLRELAKNPEALAAWLREHQFAPPIDASGRYVEDPQWMKDSPG